MKNKNRSLEIDFYEINEEECLKFTFVERFLAQDAKEGVEKWNDFFSSINQGEKIPVIWDCLKMTGFDNKARVTWQKAIKKFKKQIETVWLITDSKTITAGAKLMSAFTSFKIKVIKEESYIL